MMGKIRRTIILSWNLVQLFLYEHPHLSTFILVLEIEWLVSLKTHFYRSSNWCKSQGDGIEFDVISGSRMWINGIKCWLKTYPHVLQLVFLFWRSSSRSVLIWVEEGNINEYYLKDLWFLTLLVTGSKGRNFHRWVLKFNRNKLITVK